jgi:hypothetical protein
MRGEERGAVAMVSAFLVIALIGICAWVTDFGYAYLNKRASQNGVDAAVLAAGQSVTQRVPRGMTCEQVRDDINNGVDGAWTAPAKPSAKSVAQSFFRQNFVNPKATLAATDILASCVPNLGLKIDAKSEMPSDAFLGSVLGVSNVPIATSASAVVGPTTGVVGVYPIAICEARAIEAAANPNNVYAFALEKADATCGLGNEVWGLLNFDGSRGNGGDDGAKHDLEFGYDKPVNASTPVEAVLVDGSPGFRSSLNSLIEDLVGREIVLPVYDEYYSAGKDYRISGFMTIEICGFQDKGNGTWNSPCAPVSPHNNERWLQFRYKNFLPAAELNTACTFLDPSCDTGTSYVVKLGG